MTQSLFGKLFGSSAAETLKHAQLLASIKRLQQALIDDASLHPPPGVRIVVA
jgi:methyl-accepting chemotaxis protein